MPVFTIGHSTRTLEEFCDLLTDSAKHETSVPEPSLVSDEELEEWAGWAAAEAPPHRPEQVSVAVAALRTGLLQAARREG